jgi:hypothetical protein
MDVELTAEPQALRTRARARGRDLRRASVIVAALTCVGPTIRMGA